MKLKKLTVKDGGGINSIHGSSPVIIDFSRSKFVKLTGDNGVNKTSMLDALLMACGQLGGAKQVEKFTNKDSGKIDIEFSFVGNDRLSYDVKITKSIFKLMYEGEAVPEPITKIKELLGAIGVSPMEIKNRPLKEIIKWLASYSTKSPEEFERQMDKLKTGIKQSVAARADANRTVKGLKEYLNSEPLYTNWEASEKKYVKAIDTKSLSAQLDEAGKKSDKLLQAETKLKQLIDRQESIATQIENLQNEQEEVNKSVKAGEKFVTDNSDARKNYDTIKKQYDNAATESVAYQKWQDVKRRSKELDEFETLSQKADTKEKDLLKEVQELQMEVLPDLKGVSIVMEDSHEDGGKMVKEGFYQNDISSAQMSETEWWSIVLQIWKKNKTKIVVIDNYQSLGSDGVAKLEALVKDGAYVLVAEMNRQKKELELEYQ